MNKWIIVLAVIASIQVSEAKSLGTSLYALRSGLLSNILAKELCSCVFVTGAFDRLGKDEALKRCIKRANLPLSEKLMNKLVKLVVVTPGSIEIKPKALGEVATLGKMKKATAVFDHEEPKNGCSLKF